MRSWSPIVVLASLAALPAAGQGPSRTADKDLIDEVRALTVIIAEIRETPWERAPVALRAGEAVRATTADVRARTVLSAERLAARGRAWADVGLGDSRSPTELLHALASDVAGASADEAAWQILVDPERLTDRDFEPAGGDEGEAALLMATGVRRDEPLLIHVMMHLHQAQRGRGDPGEATDRLLAWAAWREGEANLVAIRYLFRTMGIADEVIELGLDPTEVLEGSLVPAAALRPEEAVDRLLDFVFNEGFVRAVELQSDAGWPALEAAAAMRLTTRDVLHTDREPRVASVPLPAPVWLPEGWVAADDDALGEMAIVALVSTQTGKDNLGLLAGDGWAGDRLVRFEPPGGSDSGAGVTLWRTRWDSEEAAADFEYAFRRTLGARFPGLAAVSEDGLAVRGGTRVFRFERAPGIRTIRIADPALDARLEAVSETPRD